MIYRGISVIKGQTCPRIGFFFTSKNLAEIRKPPLFHYHQFSPDRCFSSKKRSSTVISSVKSCRTNLRKYRTLVNHFRRGETKQSISKKILEIFHSPRHGSILESEPFGFPPNVGRVSLFVTLKASFFLSKPLGAHIQKLKSSISRVVNSFTRK